METKDLLKERLKLIINQYSGRSDVSEFELLVNELNNMNEENAIAVPNNSFFSKIIASIRAKFFQPKEVKPATKGLEEIKKEAIQLYCDKILKKDCPITINKIEMEGADADFEHGFELHPHEKLLAEIENYEKYHARLKEKENGRIEVYPWLVQKETLESAADKEYLKISEEFFTTKKSIEEILEERTTALSSKNKMIKSRFMQCSIEPYYGTPKFICERSQYILQCMEAIIAEQKVKPENKELTKQLIDEARTIVRKIVECETSLSTRQENDKYEEMKMNFEKLLLFEDRISKDVEQIWSEFLTKPEEYEEGKRFAFLVHAYTGEMVGADRLEKCCCTLVTDKCMPIPYGNTGIICDFKAPNIGTMCIEDAGSWSISQEEFFERGICVNWQFAENSGSGKNKVYYENPKISKLILPTTMEKEMLNKNIAVRAKNAKGAEFIGYTEIYMVKGENNQEIPIQEMFYTNENGKAKAMKKALEGNYHPILIDPSLGTVVPFYGNKNKDQATR